MRLARLMRHMLATRWRTRQLFPRATLDAIERAVAEAERSHRGQIRVAIETALPPLQVWRDRPPSERAIEVFSHLRVWDTQLNNGVLIYVQMADRHVEIVADRGIAAHVGQDEWGAVCRLMEQSFRAGRYGDGVMAGVAAVGGLLASHFPADTAAVDDGNELPDRPALI